MKRDDLIYFPFILPKPIDFRIIKPDDVVTLDFKGVTYMTTEPNPNTEIVQDIEIALIDEPIFDSRVIVDTKTETAEIGKLAESIRVNGQLQPIVVIDTKNGRYRREFGGRRIRAALANSQTTIKAIVRDESSDPTSSIVNNIEENAQRKNLTSFEEARAAMELRKLKIPGKQAARMLGCSQQKISDFGGMMERLPPPVLEDWKANHPAVNIHDLAELARSGMPPEAMTTAWNATKTAYAESLNEPEERETGRKKKKVVAKSDKLPLSQARFRDVLKALRAKGTPDKIGGSKKWALNLVEYLCQKRENPPEGIEIEETENETE